MPYWHSHIYVMHAELVVQTNTHNMLHACVLVVSTNKKAFLMVTRLLLHVDLHLMALVHHQHHTPEEWTLKSIHIIPPDFERDNKVIFGQSSAEL